MTRVLCTFLYFNLLACGLLAAEPVVKRNVPYGSGERKDAQQTLDLYAPADAKKSPVMIWIHGGAWQIGDKNRVEEKPKAFNDRGFLFVSVNYRLHPATDYRGQAADVAQAIRWVREHAAEYGGDSERIFLMGHSAGAHLAALVAIDPRYLKAEGIELSALRGVVLLDGAAYDIPRQIELAALPRMKQMYREVFTEDEAKQKEASPVTHIAKDRGTPPFLILHVASRRDGKIQSTQLAEKLTAAGVEAKVVAAENKTHATINREFGMAGDVPTKAVFEFLDARLKR